MNQLFLAVAAIGMGPNVPRSQPHGGSSSPLRIVYLRHSERMEAQNGESQEGSIYKNDRGAWGRCFNVYVYLHILTDPFGWAPSALVLSTELVWVTWSRLLRSRRGVDEDHVGFCSYHGPTRLRIGSLDNGSVPMLVCASLPAFTSL